jgi:hypothetical protein
MFLAQNLHPDPERLVEEYLHRDGVGEFLSSLTNHWDIGARTCPGHEAGFDGATVVTSWDVELLARSQDAATYRVTYHVLGPLSDDSIGGLKVAPGLEQDTFPVIHTRFGWRIDSSLDLDPHILPRAALLLQLKHRDRKILDSMVTVTRAGA